MKCVIENQSPKLEMTEENIEISGQKPVYQI